MVAFEDVIAVKMKEMQNHFENLTESCRQKEESKAKAQTNLSNVSQELDATTKTMQDGTKLFDEANAAWTAKAAEWNKRVRAHSEELAEIAESA